MDLHKEIARVAYELYEKSGRVNGKDKEHWLEAERIVNRSFSGLKAAREMTSTAPLAPKTKKARV